MSRLLAISIVIAGLVVHAGTASAQTTAAPTVGEVRVVGTQRIDPSTVRTYAGIEPGAPATPQAIDNALKALFATGLFADVRVTVEGNALVIEVRENPIINRIAFEGNERIEDDKLLTEIESRPRVVFTRTRVQNDVARILELYRRSGRFAASVEPKIIERDQNRVDLVFEIAEGPRTRVRRISFVGNDAFSDARLREEIETRESRWYRFLTTSDTYDPDRLAFDRELLRRFYLSRGYADFRVTSAVAELSPDQSEFFVTFTIDEGERYRLGKVEIVSEIAGLEPGSLQDHLETEEGDWYDASAVEDTVAALTEAIETRQIPFVDVVPDVRRNRDERTIDVTYRLTPGPRVYVERINIQGNVRTLDYVIRRELLVAEGDPLNLTRLRRSEQRIRNLGFFERVEVTQQPGSAQDQVVINVTVAEQSTGELSLGGGYDTVDGFLVDFSFRERNLLGRGQDLSASATLSQRRTQYNLSFTEPYFLDRDLSAGIDLFNVTQDRTGVAGYKEETIGLGLRLGYPLGENLRQNLTYRLERDEVTDVVATAPDSVKAQAGTRITSMISQELIYDTRDNRFDPREGYSLRFSTDVAGLGGDTRFVRNRAIAGAYFPIADQLVLSVGGEVGYVFGFGQDVGVQDRFFLGGDNLRGFATGGAGPRQGGVSLGGNLVARGSVELSFPLGLPEEVGIRGRAFTDVGTIGVLDETGVDDSLALRASAGVGLTWNSPLGPLRFDYALPFRREDTDEVQRFRFGFATRF